MNRDSFTPEARKWAMELAGILMIKAGESATPIDLMVGEKPRI